MNTKMKVLSLALVGAFGYVGAASAACPSSPTPPWTAANALGGTLAIATPGYAGTECRLDSAITGDSTSFATVQDDTPNAEARYRAHFIINADNLSGLGVVDAAFVFSALSTANPQIQISIVGDGVGGRLVTFLVPNSSAAGGFEVQSFPIAAGENHVEFDLDNSGHFSVWVNNSNEATPTYTTTTFNNGGATIETAFLGLAGATPGFISNFNGKKVGFDQFDSRRQSFIGF